MKKRSVKKFKNLRSGLFFLLLILNLSNCKEKVEGCLDIEATNYAFSAVQPCSDDCCTYPNLSLEVAFRWDTLAFIFGQEYDLEDKVIKVTNSKFYISELALINDADTFRVIDNIDLIVNEGSSRLVNFTDDFELISRGFTSFNYEIGEIRGAGTYDSLRFVVGLSQVANKVDPTSAPDGHPMAIQSDSMWSVENGYVFNKIQIMPDTMPPRDTIVRTFNVSNSEVEIVLPFNIDVEIGTDQTIPIIIDYAKWFEGINFDYASESDSINILDTIVEQTANAFSINQ